MKRQTGLSRFELAIGTTVFAVLLGSLLPRFFHVQNDARSAKLMQVYGEVSSAIRTTHAALLARQSGPDTKPCSQHPPAGNRLEGLSAVCINGTIVLTRHGYPATIASSEAPGLIALVSFAQTRQGLPALSGFLQAGLSYEQSNGVARIGLLDSRDPKHCFFDYTEALAAGSTAILGEPVTTGC